MKEQADLQSFGSTSESHQPHIQSSDEHRPVKQPKTRHIHKDKSQSSQEQQTEKQRIKVTKEERARIQKQKNREAAQRSRDIHKEYVTSLEQEVENLKEQLSISRRYCHRCRQGLQNGEEEFLIEPNLQLSLESEGISLPVQAQGSNSEAPQFDEPDSFLRILQPQQENSILKLMLFVCMIVIAVMVGFNKEPSASQPRSLVQMYSQSATSSLKQDAVEVQQIEKWGANTEKGLVELNRHIQDPVCLDSLMKVESLQLKKSLRSIHDSSYKEQMDTIMLCSLRFPKSYQIQPELTETPLVKLFVLGSQIKDLVSRSGSWMSLLDRNIQLNGIYRLAAEIKNVELVSHHNCLI